jgi:hypothetical protein
MSVCVARTMAWSKVPSAALCEPCAAPCMHMHVRASKARKSSTSGTSAHAIVRLYAAALSYPAESADTASEYTIGLRTAQAQLTVWRVFYDVFFAVSSRWLTLCSAISCTYEASIGHIIKNCGLRIEIEDNACITGSGPT